MNNIQIWISLIIPALGLLIIPVTGYGIYQACKYVRAQIYNSCVEKVISLNSKIAALEDEPLSPERVVLLREEILNIYENFCAHYIDGNIDKSRFEKSYARDIRQIFENSNFKDFLDTDTTAYPCIREVYRKLSQAQF